MQDSSSDSNTHYTLMEQNTLDVNIGSKEYLLYFLQCRYCTATWRFGLAKNIILGFDLSFGLVLIQFLNMGQVITDSCRSLVPIVIFTIL